MKTPNSIVVHLLLTSLFCASSNAWPWPLNAKSEIRHIVGRQDNPLPSDSTITPPPTPSPSYLDPVTDSASPSRTRGSETGKSKSASGSHHATKTTSIDPRLPPGGVNMMTPNPFLGEQFYKVGDYVTFGWNYTSLSVTPTAIDVFASCASNNQMYTIAMNQSIQGTAGAVTWDTGDYQATASIPLLVATYTLVIYDAAKDVTAIPSAGYLGTFDQYYFGMYTPQPYTPLAEFTCATCGGAASMHERQALAVLLITATITMMSFTWFAGGAGVFS